MQKLEVRAADGSLIALTAQGAHLYSWQTPTGTDSQERLFLSRRSAFAEGKAIRGGVPVIFPQFSDFGPLPRHGFARTALWQVLQQGQDDAGNAIAELELRANPATLAIWPYQFSLKLAVQANRRQLRLQLSVENTDTQAFSFSSALHSYFALNELTNSRLQGLQGLHYLDNLLARQSFQESAAELVISQEIDRVYQQAQQPLLLQQAGHSLRISQQGFVDAVVWNPGASAAKLNDMELAEAEQMLCIEAARIIEPVHLAAGASWTGEQLIELLYPD